MIKRVLAFCLVLCMVWPLLTACSGPNRSLAIIEDGTCNIVFDPETASSKTVNTLVAAMEELAGVEVTSSHDGEITKGTILLGNVVMDDKGNRIAAELRNQDFTVGIIDDCYLIGGITQDNTAEAVEYFIENVLPDISDDGQKLKVSAKNNYTQTGTYRLEGVTIGGEGLGHFSIVIPKKASVSELRTAALLRQQISIMTGFEPKIVSDEEAVTEAQIRIGTSLCTKAVATEAHSYAIAIAGKVMEIAAESYLGYQAAQDILSNKVFHTKNTTPQMDDSLAYTGNGQEYATEPLEKNGELRILFNNIHGWDEGGTMPVQQPTEMLTELYLEYLPDILGLQEYTPNSQKAGLPKLLESEYAAAYESRTFTSVFYRTATVECLKSGYLGFDSLTYNEYPELLGHYTGSQIKHVNKNRDGKEITSNGRVDSSKGVTWGIFRVKATGKLIMVGSTHLWWEGNEDMDEIARKIQIKALREHLSEQAALFATENGLSSPIPIVVGGDYNTSQRRSGTALSVMSQPGNSFTHANDVATVKLNATTHHGYATYNPELGIYESPLYSGNDETHAIDHIFLNTASQPLVTVNTYGVINDLYAHLSSDHNPIYIDINFQNSAPALSN